MPVPPDESPATRKFVDTLRRVLGEIEAAQAVGARDRDIDRALREFHFAKALERDIADAAAAGMSLEDWYESETFAVLNGWVTEEAEEAFEAEEAEEAEAEIAALEATLRLRSYGQD